MRAISAQVRKNNGKPLEIKSSSLEGVSPMVQNIAGALITAGVGVVSGGVIAAGHEAHNVQAQDIMDQIKKDADPTLLHRIFKALNWMEKAFTGRALSATIGEERVANYKKEILEYADSVMKLDSIGLVEIYPGSIKFAQAA